jgi:hypothetical protein
LLAAGLAFPGAPALLRGIIAGVRVVTVDALRIQG